MKILVIGRGVAALSFIEQFSCSRLATDSSVTLKWVSANHQYPTCSLNSTGLVALQGIKQGVSPLGDLLNRSYYTTDEFFKRSRPVGVESISRYNVNTVEKLERRFSHLYPIGPRKIFGQEIGLSVCEPAYSIHPKEYLSWWEDRLGRLGFYCQDDLITQMDRDTAYGLKSKYEFDYCVEATGALGLKMDLGETNKSGEVSVGHYYVFNDVTFISDKVNSSFALSFYGHNFTYQKGHSAIIFGGTTEDDEVLCPKSRKLDLGLEMFRDKFPLLDFTGNARIISGARHKAPRRLPKVIRDGNVFGLCGLYKNGYTAGHELAKEVIAMLCS